MRQAARNLRTPLGVAVVATVALATAACTAIGVMVDAALLRPPSFRDAERLAVLYITRQSSTTGVERQRWSFRRFLLLRAAVRPTLFSEVATFTRASALTLTGDADPEPVEAEVVSGGYFRVLDVQPALGRRFSVDESDASLAHAEVILGHDLWRRRFGGDSSILGRRVTINRVGFTVVGVLPAQFSGLTGRAELWIAPAMAAVVSYADYLKTNQNFISVIGRLAPGVRLGDAVAALPTIGAAIDRAEPSVAGAAGDRFGATTLSLNAARVDPRERAWVLLLLGAVGFLFFLACANVANLLIARALGRRRELAIRAALGATRMDITRAVFAEGALLAFIGGVAGASIAAAVLPVLAVPSRLIGPRNMYGSIGAFAEPTVDLRFFALALGVSVLAALLCAALPAVLPQGFDLTRDLKEGAPSTTLGSSPRRLTARSLMVALETAIALTLLVAGGLMAESYRRLRATPLGFTTSGLLTFWIRPSEVEYPPWRAPSLITRVLAEIENVPGVVAATVDGCTPASTGCANSTLYVIGRPQPKPEDAPPVLRHYVAPEHFVTLGVPLVRGRTFTAEDRAGGRRVAIINRLAAERFFPNEDPIGKRVWFGGGSNFDRPDSAAEIIGIVGNLAYQSLDERPMQPDFYTPYAQFTYASRAVLVRTLGNPATFSAAVGRAVRRADPALALYDVRTMEERLGDASAARRFDTMLLSIFALVAVLLAAMGIYAVVAHSVAQRTREVGIRVALGATSADVMGLVIREGITLPALGLLLGIASSLALTRVIQSALYGVSARSPVVYVVLTLLLAMLAFVACYVPARRAAKVDPLTALRG
jgi:putative ABC transport system permease protein